jgi:hypothetical protein
MTFVNFLYLAVGCWLGWFLGPAVADIIPKIIREIRETRWRQ